METELGLKKIWIFIFILDNLSLLPKKRRVWYSSGREDEYWLVRFCLFPCAQCKYRIQRRISEFRDGHMTWLKTRLAAFSIFLQFTSRIEKYKWCRKTVRRYLILNFNVKTIHNILRYSFYMGYMKLKSEQAWQASPIKLFEIIMNFLPKLHLRKNVFPYLFSTTSYRPSHIPLFPPKVV